MRLDNLKSIFRKIQSEILLYKEALAGTSILLLCALFGTYLFGGVAPHDVCINAIYTSAYGPCTKHIAEYVSYFEVILGAFSLLIPLVFIFVEPIIRKRFLKFLKWYIPLATIFAILGYYARFCLMWSCGSMLGIALAIDLLVFLAFFLSIGWSLLSKRGLMMILLLPPFILFVAYAVTIIAEEAKKSPQEIDQMARNDGGKSCYKFNGVRERDQCLFLNGFQCDKIVSPDIKQECSDMLQRNQAVDSADTKGCAKIIGDQQRSVCYKLIQETLRR